MSTTSSCIFCFECLIASLEDRTPLPFFQIERTWELFLLSVSHNNLSGINRDFLVNGKYPQNEHESERWIHSPSHTNIIDSIKDSSGPDSTRSGSIAVASRHFQPLSNLNAQVKAEARGYSLSSSASTLSARSSDATSSSSAMRSADIWKTAYASSERSGKSPMFVTWNMCEGELSKSLRGCIGTFEPQSLEDGLRTYALTSAFEDSRFTPISKQELPNLECCVTLLTNFEPIASPLDWEIGLHGLRINFVHQSRRYNATYLPDVAKEQGWTKLETIINLMRKAGWLGRAENWKQVTDLQITRYQGKPETASYSIWKAWHEWRQKLPSSFNIDS